MKSDFKTYDVIIVGQGPGGMSAAIYTSRANLKTLIIERGLPGGQLNNTESLDNYLGTPKVNAMDLAKTMHEHSLAFGAEEEFGDVQSIDKVDELFHVKTETDTFVAKSVIVATGTQYKKIGIPGEDIFTGRGVSYCAVCDGPFFNDKHIVVIGGGDSALEESDYLSQFGEVTIIHRRSEYSGQPLLQERVKKNPRISEIMNAQVTEILGEDKVEIIKVIDNASGQETMMNADGVFIYVGQNPQTEFLDKVTLTENDEMLGNYSSKISVLNHEKYIGKTDESYMTLVPGLFTVGDILNKKVRQVANAVGEGAVAGQSAYEYIKETFE